ncbi:MAG: TonB-dependent receptor [Caulobacteraceae bacterium]|nr:TonB-dependent receptor [Caulobacteraceae bacterium]
MLFLTTAKARLLGAASLMALIAAPAMAAETPPAPSAAEELNTIIVTAQKREQNKIDVPITLSAFKGQALDKAGVQDLHDLSALTPGFYVQNQSVNDPGIVMRGITDDSSDSTDEPRVSIYQDGVPISRVTTASVELFDLQRVEVAKGPQTTLFGRSALTGAINMIQNKAQEDHFDWSAKVETGNYNYRMFEAMVNIPIDEHLAIRLSGRTKDRDGYIKNVLGGDPLNGADANAYRIAVNYNNGAYNNDLLFNYETNATSGTAFKNKTFYPADPATGAVLGDLSPWSSAALNNSASLEGGRKLGVRRRIIGLTDIASWNIDSAFKLTSTAAWRHDRGEEVFDPDGFGFPILTGAVATGGSQYSEELRLNYDNGGRFSAFAGASFFHEDQQDRTPLVFDERTALALITGVLNRTNPNAGAVANYTNPNLMAAEIQGLLGAGGVTISGANALALANNLKANHWEQSITTSKTTSYDLFFDATFKPIDKLEISAGVRYSNDDKRSGYSGQVGDRSILGGIVGLEGLAAKAGLNRNTTGNCTIPQVAAANQICQLLAGLGLPGAGSASNYASALPLFGVEVQPTAGNGGLDTAKLSDGGLSWRLTARYALAPTQSLYATYARGRRPQVLAALSPSSPLASARFTPEASETLDNFEGGYKALFFHRRLSLDTAIYYNQYRHFSTQVLSGAQFVVADAGRADTYGFEGQATWAATSDIDLHAAYAYTHGRFGNGLLKGNRFRLTPDHSLSVGGTFRYHALGGTFDLVPSYQWKSKYYFNDDNGDPSKQSALVTPLQTDQYQNAYGVMDLRLGYSRDAAHWRVELFSTNIADQKFLKDGGNTGLNLGLPTYIPGEPRFFGVSFTIKR